jgi:hypothetical protein
VPIADIVTSVVMLSKSRGKSRSPIIAYALTNKKEQPTRDKNAAAIFHNVIKGIIEVAISKTKDHLKI